MSFMDYIAFWDKTLYSYYSICYFFLYITLKTYNYLMLVFLQAKQKIII